MSHFSIPAHVLTGKEGLKEAVPYMKEYGKKAFVVTGPHVGKSPMMEVLKNELSGAEIQFCIFDDITGEPTDEMIQKGAAAYIHSDSDFIIGMGGGSPIDSAKAIAVIASNGGNISSYMGKEIVGNLPKLVAIPTTAGTGSEATKFTVITDTKADVKMLLKGDVLIPDLAILNYEFTMDMPQRVTASTGLDALTHAVEAFTSKRASDLTDVYAISAVKRIMKYLPEAYLDGTNKKARGEMALAAYEAGVCINNSSVTLVHGLSRPIGALFHVPHGLSNAMLLGECLSFALDGAYEKFAVLGRVCGAADAADTDKAAAEKFLSALKELCKICQVPTLKEYGIPEEFLAMCEKMAADAIASGSPGNTMKNVTHEDCMNIYRKAYV